MNHLYFGPSFVFWGTALGRFSQCFSSVNLKNTITYLQQIKLAAVEKYVDCIMAFFTPFNFVRLSQVYSTTSPVSFTKLHEEIIE